MSDVNDYVLSQNAAQWLSLAETIPFTRPYKTIIARPTSIIHIPVQKWSNEWQRPVNIAHNVTEKVFCPSSLFSSLLSPFASLTSEVGPSPLPLTLSRLSQSVCWPACYAMRTMMFGCYRESSLPQRRQSYFLLIRPSDIHVGGHCILPVFLLLSSFFFSPPNLRSPWTELNDNRPHGRK